MPKTLRINKFEPVQPVIPSVARRAPRITKVAPAPAPIATRTNLKPVALPGHLIRPARAPMSKADAGKLPTKRIPEGATYTDTEGPGLRDKTTLRRGR